MSEHEQLHTIIGKNIRERRERLNLSQELLADSCGLHRTYIGAIERGERNLTVNTLAKVAVALGCTSIDLLAAKTLEAKKL